MTVNISPYFILFFCPFYHQQGNIFIDFFPPLYGQKVYKFPSIMFFVDSGISWMPFLYFSWNSHWQVYLFVLTSRVQWSLTPILYTMTLLPKRKVLPHGMVFWLSGYTHYFRDWPLCSSFQVEEGVHNVNQCHKFHFDYLDGQSPADHWNTL